MVNHLNFKAHSQNQISKQYTIIRNIHTAFLLLAIGLKSVVHLKATFVRCIPHFEWPYLNHGNNLKLEKECGAKQR